jgi:hypothetical protein
MLRPEVVIEQGIGTAGQASSGTKIPCLADSSTSRSIVAWTRRLSVDTTEPPAPTPSVLEPWNNRGNNNTRTGYLPAPSFSYRGFALSFFRDFFPSKHCSE